MDGVRQRTVILTNLNPLGIANRDYITARRDGTPIHPVLNSQHVGMTKERRQFHAGDDHGCKPRRS